LSQARDLAELQFEWRRHRRRHGLRIGARQLGRDLKANLVGGRHRISTLKNVMKARRGARLVSRTKAREHFQSLGYLPLILERSNDLEDTEDR
jgi:hypothetical protein